MTLQNLSTAQIQAIRKAAIRERARKSFIHFVTHTKPDYEVQWFHALLADYLDKFARGIIKKLMIFMPPQHGKSQLVSRHLPAYMLGINPKLKIVGCSYSSVLSQSFNRDIKRIITDPTYAELFPNTKISEKNVVADAKGAWLNNSEIFEIIDYKGFYKNTGIGGSLTGTTADIGIIDDPVKDAAEADSLTIRSAVWDWYESVFISRAHNKSQQLLTMTRWHDDDLAGRILKSNDAKNWTILKLPAIRTETQHHPADVRSVGEALWESRHSSTKIRMSSERVFEALYQQNPLPTKGGLVFPEVVLIDEMPTDIQKRAIGLDFGFTNDPTAAIECGVIGNKMFLDQIIYEQGLVNSQIAGRLPKNIEVFCDSAEPKSIEELRRYGVRMAKAAQKGRDSILAGLAILHEYELHITKRSFGLINEQSKYTYKTDGYGLPMNDPIDDFNHAWDAIRYYALSKLSRPEKGIYMTR